jgi:phage/plasmid primase-like uncharacterized protein
MGYQGNPDKLVFTAGDLLLTAQDVTGEIRSVQSIQENGMKRFANCLFMCNGLHLKRFGGC